MTYYLTNTFREPVSKSKLKAQPREGMYMLSVNATMIIVCNIYIIVYVYVYIHIYIHDYKINM